MMVPMQHAHIHTLSFLVRCMWERFPHLQGGYAGGHPRSPIPPFPPPTPCLFPPLPSSIRCPFPFPFPPLLVFPSPFPLPLFSALVGHPCRSSLRCCSPRLPCEISDANSLAWLPLQSLAVKKNFFFVQILGGEKLFKFVEKCRWKTFKRPERG